MCGGIFDTSVTANLPRNIPLKIFLKSGKNWQNYGHESVAPFLAHPVVTSFSLKPMTRILWGSHTVLIGLQ